MIAVVEERRAHVGVAPLCDALGLARATFYRWRRRPGPEPPMRKPRRAPRHALTPADREAVLALLHEDRFVDLPPAQVSGPTSSTRVRCRPVRSARCTECSRPMPKSASAA